MVADKSIFTFDPAITNEMKMVEEWRGFKIGMKADFRLTPQQLLRGEIIAIGENAKYFDGKFFVAFAVKVDGCTHFTTHKEIHHVI